MVEGMHGAEDLGFYSWRCWAFECCSKFRIPSGGSRGRIDQRLDSGDYKKSIRVHLLDSVGRPETCSKPL